MVPLYTMLLEMRDNVIPNFSGVLNDKTKVITEVTTKKQVKNKR